MFFFSFAAGAQILLPGQNYFSTVFYYSYNCNQTVMKNGTLVKVDCKPDDKYLDTFYVPSRPEQTTFECTTNNISTGSVSLIIQRKSIKTNSVQCMYIFIIIGKPCNLYYYLNRQVQFGCCHSQHHAQPTHPTENFNSMSLLQMFCVITWDQKKSAFYLRKK